MGCYCSLPPVFEDGSALEAKDLKVTFQVTQILPGARLVVRKNSIRSRKGVSPMTWSLCDPAEHVVESHELVKINLQLFP